MMQEQTGQQPRIVLETEVTPVINYALHQNGARLVRSITLINDSGQELRDLELKISSDPGFCVSTVKYIDLVGPDCRYSLSDSQVLISGEFLGSLTEKVTGHLHFSLEQAGKVLVQRDEEVTVLAFDQWNGAGSYPEMLTAFITPNHPAIATLTARASDYLRQWGLDPSLEGYQSKDPNRILKMAGAAYAAMQELGIVYTNPPASFETAGQRVRLCDAVLSQKQGTCLDLTLTYAGVLEAMGLHPLLILLREHIFAGVWLEENTFPDPVIDDRTAITKRMAKGVNEIALVECTALTAGRSCGFDEARGSAEREMLQPIELIVDVARARLSGITPLPQRIRTEAGWEVVPQEKKPAVTPSEPEKLPETVITDDDGELAPVPKMTQWERKLLDLGLRNQLISMRLTKSTVPILTPSLDELENALADGREFSVLPRPADWNLPHERLHFDTMHELGDYAGVVGSEFGNGRLRSSYSEAELKDVLKNLYRTAKVSLEENGANTLYLALGLLRWYESDRSTKPRFAPVVLVPVEIVRKSAAKGYVIRLREDEAHMNITILEKLKQDFGIQVKGLDPLPQDEHGIDIRKVMTTLRQAVMSKKGWDTLESAYLGIFSFSQFVMWNDLRNRADDLQRNKIVRSLMEGRLVWEGIDMSEPGAVGESKVFLPLSADASQLFAIEAAAAGHSFVLHGPPGSGKSQTITALIANALANGQSLLFIAEKMAALEVVQKRLENIGLGPFCLEVHSNKAKKREVLDQLRRVMELSKQASPREFEDKANEIAVLRADLDQYVQALHKVQPCGKSLFELIGDYDEVCQADELEAFSQNWIAALTGEDLNRQRRILEQLVSAGRQTGHPSGHPLSAVGVALYSQRLRMNLPAVLKEYMSALEYMEAVLREAGDKAPATFDQIRRFCVIASELEQWKQWPAVWLEGEELHGRLQGVQKMALACKRADELRGRLEVNWKESFLQQDGSALVAEYNTAQAAWFLPRMMSMNALIRRMAPHSKEPLDREQLPDAFALLEKYQKAEREAAALREQYGSGLEKLRINGSLVWDAVYTAAAQAEESADRLRDRDHACEEERRLALLLGSALIMAWDRVLEARKVANDLLQLTDGVGERWVPAQIALCRSVLENADRLKEWAAWNAAKLEAWEAGLQNVEKAYSDGLDHDRVLPAWQKAVSRELAMLAIDESHVLNTFAGSVFNEKIARFARLDQELTELTRREIFYRLASRLPNFPKEAAHSSEVGILQRAIRSGGRGLSLRKLFDQIPNLLPRMCPCMLMSPISAAQYLDPKREPFDLVVFDEASQLPTCKAVGALARGHNAVIVGDPKQMPPTTFFATNTVDEEHLDTEDLESILDDCLALNMPQTHLRWHYRSRHESLIAFSNSRFYEGRLLTFPSVNDRESKVRLVHVDGIFERSKNRQNRAEAEAVVAEIKRRCHDEQLRCLSVGVVTFNIHQQELIDDLLTAACAEDPELDKWAYEGEEPLFIKNLENVQGDERDVILFSIGYGPDEHGRVYMNFGPLNREGGWRRLNVAISRARHEMTVYSTLQPEQIDLSRTGSEGVAALKAFLEYAGGKELPQTAQTAVFGRAGRNSIAASICRALEEMGYRTQRNVGRSEYRIDVGVIDPEDPQRYMLGILLDGTGYRGSKTTRDRELAQISVLKGLGWKILRVWSMDWWDNSRKERVRIREALERIAQGLPLEEEVEPTPETGKAEPAVEEIHEAPSLTVKPYTAARLPKMEMTADDFVHDGNLINVRVRIRAVLEQEAPVSRDVLMRRVLKSCGISRAGERITPYMTAMMEYMGVDLTEQQGVTFCWRNDQDPRTYMGIRASGDGEDSRDVKDICVQEIVNAVCLVLSDQVSMAGEDLIRECAKLLGYSRVTDAVRTAMEMGMGTALEWGLVIVGVGGNPVLTEEGTTRTELIRKVALVE